MYSYWLVLSLYWLTTDFPKGVVTCKIYREIINVKILIIIKQFKYLVRSELQIKIVTFELLKFKGQTHRTFNYFSKTFLKRLFDRNLQNF